MRHITAITAMLVVLASSRLCLADVVALKRDPGLTHTDPLGTGNDDSSVLDASFQALGPADVVVTTVADAQLFAGTWAGFGWRNYGITLALDAGSGTEWGVYRFDLAGLGPIGQVNKAELRLYITGGNTGSSLSRLLTPWSEGNKDGDYPGSDPSAVGCSHYHPNGLQTGPNQLPDGAPDPNSPADPTGTWAAGAFGAADYDMTRGFKSGTNNRWKVWDVTDIIQSWAEGATNCGLSLENRNYSYHLSEAGTDQQPVLFLDYLPDEPPLPVTDLAVSRVDWFEIELTWTAPSDVPPGAVENYDIRYSTDPIDPGNFDAATPVADPPVPAAPGTTEYLIVGGLLPETTYYFAIQCVDRSDFRSPLSNVVNATTTATDAVPPATATDLTITDTKPNYVTLSWTMPGDDGFDGLAADYELRYSTAPVDDMNFADATLATTPPAQPGGTLMNVTVHGLDPATDYYFALKARDEVPNWSGLSNVPMTTTLAADLDPPYAVTDLMYLGGQPHAAYLRWTAPADVGAAGVGAYDVRYSLEPITELNWDAAMQADGEPAPAPPGTVLEMTIPDLDDETCYYFALKSCDLAEPTNVSALSNVEEGCTPMEALAVVLLNPWIVNDRVADCRSIETMGQTFYKDYTPDGVVEPTTNEQRVINSYNNFKRRYYHWATEPPNNNDLIRNLNVFGWALCGRHADGNISILDSIEAENAFGIGTRKISLPGHWIWEAQYGGKWHAYDTMTTMYLYNRATPANVASCEEIKQDNSLMLDARAEGRECPGFLLCGDSESWFAGAINSYGTTTGGAVTTYSMDMNLALGQTFQRTWQAWQDQHPPAVTNADTEPGPDPPYHHECQHDWKDYVNWSYWEPYGAIIPYIHSTKATYRRWANGTLVIAPDFTAGGAEASMASHTNLAFINDDGLSPEIHLASIGSPGEVVFHVVTPFYLTDGWFDGTFVRQSAGDLNQVSVSTNGTAWTPVWTNDQVGSTEVSGQSLGASVFATYEFWVKLTFQADGEVTDAGVDSLAITLVFEHNKGAMAYLDKGVNNVTVTLDNPEDLVGKGVGLYVTYQWREYDGSGWNVAREQTEQITGSPHTFQIVTGGTKVPRTESIKMEVAPAVPEFIAPCAVTDLAAGNPDDTRIELTWTAVGDDCLVGRAASYDIRYSTSPITEGNFELATPVADPPAPQPAGTPEQMIVEGLTPSTLYYFAMTVSDEQPNVSPMSNVGSAATTALDVTPPAAITDLAAQSGTTSGSVDLNWTAPGDDGTSGQASAYDIRYSDSPITEVNFAAASPVVDPPAPQPAGSPEAMTLNGLTWHELYYFAIKTCDDKPNWSDLSNVPAAQASGLGEKTLQDGLAGYGGTRDNYMQSVTPDANFGTYERMRVTGYADLGDIQRGLVRFDLSSIPMGTPITSATLWLYSYDPAQTFGSSGFYGAYRLTRDWSETASTWNSPWTTAGGDFEATPDGTAPKQPASAVPCWYSFDVTTRVQQWINDPSGNYGWLIKCLDEYSHNQDKFYQSDTADAAHRPKLVISDVSAGPALVSSDPAADGTLPKTQNNVLLLTFDGPIALPDGNAPALSIYGGGWEEGDAFAYSVEPDGVTLRAVEEGPMLTDQTWYRISPGVGFGVQAFSFDVCTVFGDASNSGRVTTADYIDVKDHMTEYTGARYDLNGSGRVTTADYTVVKSHMNNRCPPKP